MQLTLEEEKYIFKKLIFPIIKNLSLYLFLFLFFIFGLPTSFSKNFNLKNSFLTLFEGILNMESTFEMVMSFFIFGVLFLMFSYALFIAPISCIIHNIKCLIMLKVHSYDMFSTNLIEKFKIRSKVNNRTKTTYYGLIFDGQKNIKIKIDYNYYHNLNEGDSILIVKFGKKNYDYYILDRSIIENFDIGGIF